MIDPTTASAAAEVAARLRGVEGISRLFPRRPLAEAVHAAAHEPVEPVEVESGDVGVKAAARVGMTRSHSVEQLLDGVAAALPADLADRRLDVEIEIAYIE